MHTKPRAYFYLFFSQKDWCRMGVWVLLATPVLGLVRSVLCGHDILVQLIDQQ